METWRILSNYQVHGLAWTVKHETGVSRAVVVCGADVARRYALQLVGHRWFRRSTMGSFSIMRDIDVTGWVRMGNGSLPLLVWIGSPRDRD